jgi:hypothetical protein
MKLTERQIRKIVREMALKSLNITKAQPMERGEGPEFYGSPDEAGMFPPDPGHGYKTSNPFTAEEFYSSAQRTWGRESYKKYAARQFERFPVGLNVFLLPGAAGKDVYELVNPDDTGRFTVPNDPVANAEGRRIIAKHFPDVPVEDSDFNILILTGLLHKQDPSSEKYSLVPYTSSPPKEFLKAEGVYNTFHSLFDGGPFDDYAVDLRNIADEIETIVAPGIKPGETVYGMRNSPLYGLFRVKTLLRGEVQDAREMGNELAIVALIRNTVPVRPEEFPTHDIYGAEISEAARQRGMDLAREMIPLLEAARDLYRNLAGKTIIGKPV